MLWPALLLYGRIVAELQGAGKVIDFYLFERTPPEVVILSLLLVCCYCAMQDWGTILRVQQILLFLAYGFFFLVWLSSLLNFQVFNLLPLWPVPAKEVGLGSLHVWQMCGGYESALLLLSEVGPKASRRDFLKTAAMAAAGAALVLLLVTAGTLGAMTAESSANVPYPVLMVIRSVELPGTFVERLENYLLLAWVPIVFASIALQMYLLGRIGMGSWQHNDHRPWVLLAAPLVYIGSMMADTAAAYEGVRRSLGFVALGFYGGAVPLALALGWYRQRVIKGD